MSLEWKQSALKDMEGLAKPIQTAIIKRMLKVEENPPHFLERLVGLPYYKVRCGDYRVFIDWKKSTNQMAVLRVLHRKNAYKEKW